MRRKDREITDYNTMLGILDSCTVCRIGLTDPDSSVPYIVPLNFGWTETDGRLTLYFHGAKTGKKMDLIKASGCCSFEMDTDHALVTGEAACEYSFKYHCIMGKGHIETVDDHEEKLPGLTHIMRHYAGAPGAKLPVKEEIMKATCVMKLTVDEWSCKGH